MIETIVDGKKGLVGGFEMHLSEGSTSVVGSTMPPKKLNIYAA